MDCLIGYSGFVGSTLLKQKQFASMYRSSNIEEIANKSFATIVCAGVPAQKWLANRDPVADRNNIVNLIGHLEKVKCETFILISTVDVFKNPVRVNEDSAVDENELHAYGLHRRLLEKFVSTQFSNHLIARLPGLVGPGLRKNIVFDFLNDNNLNSIDSRAIFQFYPMVNLWCDIQIAVEANLQLVHLTAAPISVAEVAQLGFGKQFTNIVSNNPAEYDIQTRFAKIFGGNGNYQYNARESILAIRSYDQSEPRANINK